MKAAFAIFAAFVVTAQAAEEYCYKDVVRACKSTTNKQLTSLQNCNAKYGAIDAMQADLQRYANDHFLRSFDYLLMSTHYANYQKNRLGFEKLFRSLSDSLWNDGIDLIKYISSRGGEMSFNIVSEDIKKEEPNLELYEIEALAKSLEMQKQLALEVHNIHREASRRKEENHDPEITSHLENTFVHKHRDTIRKLSGYVRDLSTLLDGPDSSLSLFLFDEYLQKQ